MSRYWILNLCFEYNFFHLASSTKPVNQRAIATSQHAHTAVVSPLLARIASTASCGRCGLLLQTEQRGLCLSQLWATQKRLSQSEPVFVSTHVGSRKEPRSSRFSNGKRHFNGHVPDTPRTMDAFSFRACQMQPIARRGDVGSCYNFCSN